MPKNLITDALKYHREPRPGKIGIEITKPAAGSDDLSLAYSPGVASPCLEIEKHPELAYEYTNKGNLVGVISNGTAVLGLGNIGALASKPVMEGKAMLFKKFAGIDAFDIELKSASVEGFIETVERISPTFGAINLEDIKAPECFYIELRLRELLDIPVMHDDQHGTAVVACAALINAIYLQQIDTKKMRVVINGAGAAAIAIAKLMENVFDLHRRQILMFDSKGPLLTTRRDLPNYKMAFAKTVSKVVTLEDGLRGTDVFIGVSKGDVLEKSMLKGMRKHPVVLALANPIPEIMPEVAKQARSDVIIATGRSDLPNQVNNSICFPYLFRAVLDTRAKSFTVPMMIAAAEAIAKLAREEVPSELCELAGRKLSFGPEYILPLQFDPRLKERVTSAIVASIQAERSAALNWK